MAFFADPDGNALMLHRRYAPRALGCRQVERRARRLRVRPDAGLERAVAFYRDMLGLPQSARDARTRSRLGERDARRSGDPEQHGRRVRSRDRRGDRAPRRRRRGGARGARGQGRRVRSATRDTGVCHMGFFKDPDGNVAHPPPEICAAWLGRAARALPRAAPAGHDAGGLAVHGPEGLRPGRLRPERPRPGARRQADARHRRGRARHVSRGRDRDRARTGRHHFEPLAEHERLGTLVGADDKFTAHNAASWQHGLLVRVPKGVELEQPLYVRIANSTPTGRSSGGCSSSPRRARASR